MAGNLGLAPAQVTALQLLKACTYSCLTDISPALVVRTGLQVTKAVTKFKKTKPELVPTVPGGLLGPSEVPANDFLIAEHLFDDNDLAAALRVGNKTAGQALLAYSATMFVTHDDLSPQWVESALRYVVNTVIAKNWLYKDLEKGIREKLKLLEPDAEHGKKFKGRQRDSIGPLARAIRRHLKKFPDDKPKKVWQTLERNPPKGLRFCDTRGVGKYVEYVGKPAAFDTNYHQFQNRLAEQRKFVKGA